MTIYYTYEGQIYDVYERYIYAIAVDKLNVGDVDLQIKIWYTLTIFAIIMFVIGLIGNSLTIAVIIMNKSMHTVTNYYLLNLAVVDLLVLIITMPFGGNGAQSLWRVTLCYLKIVLVPTLIFLSALTIVAIAVEGYVFMCKPLKFSSKPSTFRAIPYLVGIWSVSFVCAYLESRISPIREVDFSTCSFHSDRFLVNLYGFIFFFLPMSVSAVLYTLIGVSIVRSNKSNEQTAVHHRSCSIKNPKKIDDTTKRILKMLVIVAAIVFISWAPYHLTRLLNINFDNFMKSTASAVTFVKVLYVLALTAHIFGTLSTVIKPLIYGLMLKKFRRAYREVIKKLYHKVPKIWVRYNTESANCRATTQVL